MYVGKDELKDAFKKLDVDTLGKMESAMSGRDYDAGELEELSAGLNRAHEVIAKLIFVMVAKATLTRQEAVSIVAEYAFDKYLGQGETQ